MKRLLFIYLVLTAVAGSAQTCKDMDQLDQIVTMEQNAHRHIGQNLASTVPNNYDVKYCRFEWHVNPDILYIQGEVTTYFVPTAAGFTEIDFDLATQLTVDSVIYHGLPVTFNHLPGDSLQITLPSAVPVSTLDSVHVYYQGIPPSTGFGSFNRTTHNGSSVIWTLSEPYGAKDWWPCKQSLNDKIDSIDIIVTTPQIYRVASNGVLRSENQAGSNKIYHWQSHYPIAAYLVAIGITNYAVYSDYLPLNSTDTLEILNYVYPEDSLTATMLTPDILNVISFYDSLTIQYPFSNEKYGHAQFSWGGGEEHQTMSFVINFGHGLIAHECAHQWFGDYITCGSFEDIWLNEGFATYFEGLTEERFFPSTWHNWKSSRVNQITQFPYGSVLCNDTNSVGRIFDGRLSYSKGGYLLHMLRWKLGGPAFFQGIRNYLNDPLLAYGYAKTPELKQHLETTSGQNLTNFFDQWYYNEGYPSYQIEWNQVGSTIYLHINQTQSDASVSFFEMPLPLYFHGSGQDTTVVVDHTFSGQNFTASINFTADTLDFDPELWIISKNNTVTRNLALSTNEPAGSNSLIRVYPNPAMNEITIESANNSNLLSEVELLDVLGNVVLHEGSFQPLHRMKINLSEISSGIYFIKGKMENGTCEKRFVKM